MYPFSQRPTRGRSTCRCRGHRSQGRVCRKVGSLFGTRSLVGRRPLRLHCPSDSRSPPPPVPILRDASGHGLETAVIWRSGGGTEDPQTGQAVLGLQERGAGQDARTQAGRPRCQGARGHRTHGADRRERGMSLALLDGKSFPATTPVRAPSCQRVSKGHVRFLMKAPPLPCPERAPRVASAASAPRSPRGPVEAAPLGSLLTSTQVYVDRPRAHLIILFNFVPQLGRL